MQHEWRECHCIAYARSAAAWANQVAKSPGSALRQWSGCLFFGREQHCGLRQCGMGTLSFLGCAIPNRHHARAGIPYRGLSPTTGLIFEGSQGRLAIHFGPATIPFIDMRQISILDSHGNLETEPKFLYTSLDPRFGASTFDQSSGIPRTQCDWHETGSRSAGVVKFCTWRKSSSVAGATARESHSG